MLPLLKHESKDELIAIGLDMWIDDIIRRAIDDGQFDNLPGHGKPLNLNPNPHTPRELRGAYHIMQQAGVTPAWIGERQVIEADTEKARQTLKQAWRWFAQQTINADSRQHWQNAQDQFKASLDALNKRIRDYNLAAPTSQVHIFALSFERELERIKNS